MNKKEELSIIQGTFEVDEAQDILVNIFSSKIKFHTLKNFKSQEKNGTDDETASIRIPELKKNIELLLEILSEAKKNNKKLLIHSNINIQFIDKL